MIQSKESKLKWMKILESLHAEQDLVKSISNELSQIQVSVKGIGSNASRKANRGKGNSSDNPEDPTAAAKNIAGDYDNVGNEDEPPVEEDP